MWRPEFNISIAAGVANWALANKKNYELTNHLGNVLAVITETRTLTAGLQEPTMVSAQDYYPFGMVQPGRTTNLQNYRYGFNGKENDNEVKGTGGQQDYGMRIYDPRVGRFLSLDPLTKDYPWYTPYSFAGNMPIKFIDRVGAEPWAVGNAVSSNRAYEAELRKKDPENAEAIIRQQNMDAFMFVGGMITGGSGKLATLFWDGIMAWGGYKTSKGIINHDAAGTTEGVRLMGNAAMGEIGSVVLGRILKAAKPIILDFFGGEVSTIKGALNIDPKANIGFKGTIEEFMTVAKKNKIMGKVDKIVANNPYGYAEYIADAAQLLRKNGTITVSGTYGNKYFKQVAEGKANGLGEFDVLQGPTRVSDNVKATMKTSEGGAIKGDVYQIILKKK